MGRPRQERFNLTRHCAGLGGEGSYLGGKASWGWAAEKGAAKVRCDLVHVIEQCTTEVQFSTGELSTLPNFCGDTTPKLHFARALAAARKQALPTSEALRRRPPAPRPEGAADASLGQAGAVQLGQAPRPGEGRLEAPLELRLGRQGRRLRPMLTRTSRSPRTVRTGYTYQPLAQRTYLRHRAAAAPRVRTSYASQPRVCRTYRVPWHHRLRRDSGLEVRLAAAVRARARREHGRRVHRAPEQQG